MKPKIVTIATSKGGVGKTSIAVAFAAVAAALGKKTLVVDLDKSGNATKGLGGQSYDAGAPVAGAGQLLTEGKPRFQNIAPNLDLLAGNSDLEDPAIARFEPEALADVVDPLPYELVVIDTPPDGGLFEKLAIVAAEVVFIPTEAHPFGMDYCHCLIEKLTRRASKNRRGATEWAIVGNKIDPRRRLDKQLRRDIAAAYPNQKSFVVHQDVTLSISTTVQEPLAVAGKEFPNSKVIADITAMYEWVFKTKIR